MADPTDHDPDPAALEAELDALIALAEPSLLEGVGRLLLAGELLEDYVAHLRPSPAHGGTRACAVRFVHRDAYAVKIRELSDEVADEIQAPIGPGLLRVVILCEQMIAVRDLELADDRPTPPPAPPVNSDGGAA